MVPGRASHLSVFLVLWFPQWQERWEVAQQDLKRMHLTEGPESRGKSLKPTKETGQRDDTHALIWAVERMKRDSPASLLYLNLRAMNEVNRR